MKFLKRFFDDEAKEMKKYRVIADEVMMLDEDMQKLSDEELKAKTKEFRERLEKGETLDDILVEAFAVVREASHRVNNEKPFYVQVLVGVICHKGNIAEMKTGEGKTLSTVLPAYLNALADKVHIITVNEYLSKRNSEWMGNIYNFLGVTVGANLNAMTKEEKKQVYSCDIIYTTNNELGFDYLRDNMIVKKEDRLISDFNFAIIDEVDSILIDEARTPLIISGGAIKTANLYLQADTFVKSLKEDQEYVFDEKTKNTVLTEEGSKLAEEKFKINNLYDLNNTALVQRINQALRANKGMKKEIDYLVKDDQIIIVDPNTGRLMHGRAFSEGLHQAIEAKENVTIKEETKTVATITLQNLFRMYKKLSGLTGTAKTEEEEFRETYNMYVLEVPTNKPIARIDAADKMFSKREYKYKAMIEEVRERHEKGQPILIGTIAVETSELISEYLKKAKIRHEVLNAKNHEREADIIANAGKKGSVTIATNMAGRGTDIKIDDDVRELGGLCVIGTERHESRRIDNQLRGRAGRQGDPGYSQFFVSFEDELLIRFGSARIQRTLTAIGFGEEMAIQNKSLSKMVETAQKRVEGSNFDKRKFLLQYDEVINKQREIIYEKRNTILDEESIHEMVLDMFKDYISIYVTNHMAPEEKLTELDISEIVEGINENLPKEHKLNIKDFNETNLEFVIEKATNKVLESYDAKFSKFENMPVEVINNFEKAVVLRVMDTLWMEHINSLSHLKEGVKLRSVGQENPVRAYSNEGFQLFEDLLNRINMQSAATLMKAEIKQNQERQEVVKKLRTNDSKKRAKKVPKKVTKVGRNELCPCGSGKKYKQCHGQNK